MGRAFIEVCKFVKCLPSEFYKKHPDATIGDFQAIRAYHKILAEEEAEKINSMIGGKR